MPEETPGTPPPTDAAPAVVRRAVEVEARPEEVWHAVADPDERALWLDDPDAAARTLRVDEVVAPERLVWTWWRDDDGGDASTVSVVLTPLDDGGTRVEVTEVRLAVPRASVAAPTRPPGWARCALDRWDRRLLGLELLFVAARAGVA